MLYIFNTIKILKTLIIIKCLYQSCCIVSTKWVFIKYILKTFRRKQEMVYSNFYYFQ